MIAAKQWTIAARPVNGLEHSHFCLKETQLASPGQGQVLLKTHYLNVAPVMRRYMMADGKAVTSPEAVLNVGDVIHGRGVAEVIESRHPDFQVGDFVHGQIGWQTHKLSSVTPQEKFFKMHPQGVPAYYGLSALGMTGYSAYCGFVSQGVPQPGQAVLVSGAAGGVGSLVVQIARAMGCSPVVGIAGGEEKCQLVSELGADGVIDYHHQDVAERIAQLLPQGIDIYFDNVGGEILEAVLDNLAQNARVVLCGSISEYTRDQPFGPRNYTNLRRYNADMRGFFVYNHVDEYTTAEQQMADWIKAGKLKAVVDISDGFSSMPDALIGLYQGKNKGKQIVRVVEGDDRIY